MDIVEFDLEPSGYNVIAAFDGRVLELFSRNSDHDSRRIHIKFLSVSVSDPDKKGRRDIALVQQVLGNKVINFAEFVQLDESAFETVRPLLDALRNAGVSSNA